MASSPTLTPRGPVNITRRSGHHSEPAIAANPTNPDNLVAGANSPSGAVLVMTSQNGGQSWQTRQIGTGPMGDGLPVSFCDPSVAFDRFGNCYFVYLTHTERVIVARSIDGGLSFGSAVTVTDPDCDQPTVTTGPGTTTLNCSVWVTYRNEDGSIAVRGARATGLGAVGAFGKNFVAPGSDGGNFGDIAVGPAGQVALAYQKPSGDEGPSKIFVHRKSASTSSGAFGPAVTVTKTNVGGFDEIPAQSQRSIDAEVGLAYDSSGGPHNGRLYLLYTDEITNETNNTDIFLRVSDDNGATWSARRRVSDDTKKRSQFLPRMALDQMTGNLGFIFYDCRKDNGTVGSDGTNTIANDDVHVFATGSSDGGATFAKNIQITTGVSCGLNTGNPNEFADYIGLAFHGGFLHGAWTDNSNSTGDNPDGAQAGGDIYTARIRVQ